MSTSEPAKKRVTLADVSKVAGVSVPTVSHVLSGTKSVTLPQATKNRVLAAAKEVGYRPNRHAQAIRSGKTNVVSILMPLDRPIVTYLRFLDLLSRNARITGHDLMITGLDRESALGDDAPAPLSWPVDGVISIDAGKAIQALRRNGDSTTPVCVFGYEQVPNGDAVAWDVQGAVRDATRRLLDKGCRKIVHVTMDWLIQGFPRERRRRGYSEAMQEAGLEPQFIACTLESSAAVAEEVVRYIREFGLPDAFIGMTDAFAIGAARAVLRVGARVPEDCRIVGFGDFPESLDFVVPISTIQLPIDSIVETAWTWLSERMNDHSMESRFVELPMTFVSRESF